MIGKIKNFSIVNLFLGLINITAFVGWIVVFCEIRTPKEDYILDTFTVIFGVLALMIAIFTGGIAIFSFIGIKTMQEWVKNTTNNTIEKSFKEGLLIENPAMNNLIDKRIQENISKHTGDGKINVPKQTTKLKNE